MDAALELPSGVRTGSSRPPLPFAVFFVVAAVSSWLVAPTSGFRDSGEIGAAGHLLGVAHPTGFAVDMLLLRFAEFLPLGSIAFRQNLLVAIVSAVVLAALAHLVQRLAREAGLGAEGAATGAVLAAFGLGSWATFFGTGVTVEVYSTALLATLLGASALFASPRPLPTLGLLLGLAVGLHVSAGLGLVALVVAALRATPRGRRARAVAVSAPTFVAGALVLGYLPLASLGEPLVDWGDPQTPTRLWQHLSADRVREAFGGQMLGASGETMDAFFGHLGELAALAIPALLGLAALARRMPRVALLTLGLFTLDVVYATNVNPMGVADRQVGHLAGAAVCALAGLGVAFALDRLRGRAFTAAVALVAVLAVAPVLRAPSPPGGEGYTSDELHGGGGPLSVLPPRAVLVCATDDGCATAMFALYAEQSRPDVTLAISMHLWEPNVRARLEADFPALALAGGRRPERGADRAELAARVVGALAAGDVNRPVFFARALPGARLSTVAPYHGTSALTHGAHVAAGLEQLEGRYRARFGEATPRLPQGSVGWSQAYDEVGRGALAEAEAETAIRAFRRAVELAPGRAVAWTNLGVALAAVGALPAAVEACEHSVRLEPTRAAGWLNLARYLAALGDPNAAREALAAAAEAGVRDPRLVALAGSLR